MPQLEDEIRAIADRHVDLVAFARVDDIQLAHPPRPAGDLLKDARSVVVFAAALLRGALNCPRGTKGAVKDAQLAYDRLEQCGAAVGRHLESLGHTVYMPPASMPVDVVNVPLGDPVGSESALCRLSRLIRRAAGAHRSLYAAEWSHRQAAISASLGVKGLNNLLITPEYGPYVRLASILTTADLSPTNRSLPENLCSNCGLCVEACPVGALDPTRQPVLDPVRCHRHYIRPLIDSSLRRTVRNLLDRKFWVTTVQTLLEGYYFSCAECQRVCPRGTRKRRVRHVS